MKLHPLLILVALPLLAAGGFCASAEGEFSARSVTLTRSFPRLHFDRPLALTYAPDDARRLFVATQGGKIYVFENRPDVSAATLFLDLSDRTRAVCEEGLLGLAFDPQYGANGYFYVNYSANRRHSPGRSVVARFRVSANPDAADDGSETRLLEFQQPYCNHNGGGLAFGPDGMLYIGSGDGGFLGDPGNRAQKLAQIFGKILRLRPDGGIPADNPFVGRPGARGEIWAYGLRNPWRINFDRATGELWAADAGQNKYEEIDLIEKGANYGWRLFEGLHEYKNPRHRTPPDYVAPVFEYDHSQGCSIIGGAVYRGSALPQLAGRYVYADYCSGKVWALARADGKVLSNTLLGAVPSPTSLSEDAAGEIYITSFDGTIYKLEP